MWPFGVSKKWVNEAIHSEAALHVDVHKLASHPSIKPLPCCPLCNAHLYERREEAVTHPNGRWTLDLLAPQGDFTETFTCGSERVRKDDRTTFIAKCLTVKKRKES